MEFGVVVISFHLWLLMLGLICIEELEGDAVVSVAAVTAENQWI